ncbi:MAG: hypothetical protein R3F13_22045 [Prosthecobacter sp.]
MNPAPVSRRHFISAARLRAALPVSRHWWRLMLLQQACSPSLRMTFRRE